MELPKTSISPRHANLAELDPPQPGNLLPWPADKISTSLFPAGVDHARPSRGGLDLWVV